MKPIRTGTQWILPTFALVLSTCAIADIPSASNDCLPDTLETTPSHDFTLLEGGAVVRHKTTGLEWRRCAEGMSWSGEGCSGFSDGFWWRAALQHADGLSGWRLPNINELRSIVERCRSSPAINQQVFPDTPETITWTATPSAINEGSAWSVNFTLGTDSVWSKNNHLRVRLVRDGQ